MRRSPLALPALFIAAALALAGCASTGSPPTASTGVKIVASTNVYGDIAKQIGGEHVVVTSIIDSPDKDPHDYAATPRDQLAVSEAALVIENGGHYDEYLDTMLSSANNAGVVVLNAVDISGFDQEPASGQFNEHVWYDVTAMGLLAEQIAAELSTLDPANATAYAANAASFATEIDGVKAKEAAMHATLAGTGVAITEPVPLYLLESIGLVNKTPAAFTEAVELGTDVSPQVLSETQALITSGAVALLVFNEQTAGAQTDALIATAGTSNVPTVGVTETLPTGQTYVSWLSGYLDAINSALGQ
jgi:zinc/manganese transport system substrate-binding protein